jgi:hypothetical protein
MKRLVLTLISAWALAVTPGKATAGETPETPKEIKRIQSSLPPSVRPPAPNLGNPGALPVQPTQPQLSPSEQLQRDVTTMLQLNQFDNAEYRIKIALQLDPNDPVALSLLKRVQDARSEFLSLALRRKMSGMILEEVHFTGAPMTAVVEYLQDETKRFTEDGNPINIVLNVPPALENAPVNLRLRNVPLLDVLKYVCDAVKLDFRVDQHAVVINPVAAMPASPR